MLPTLVVERQEREQRRDGESDLEHGRDAAPPAAGDAAQPDLSGAGQEARAAQQPVKPALGAGRAPGRL